MCLLFVLLFLLKSGNDSYEGGKQKSRQCQFLFLFFKPSCTISPRVFSLKKGWFGGKGVSVPILEQRSVLRYQPSKGCMLHQSGKVGWFTGRSPEINRLIVCWVVRGRPVVFNVIHF